MVTVPSHILTSVDHNQATHRQLDNCDTYRNAAAFDSSTIVQNVTATTNFLENFNQSQNLGKTATSATSEEELQKTETTNKLLNLIVKLTRASINFNILTGKAKDEIENMKPAGKYDSNFHMMIQG